MQQRTTSNPQNQIKKRPRNLGVLDTVFHLDGPWGASLAYALPLALTLTGRLAPVYLIIISVVMFIVANGYKVICKHNPDGGGVYSSLRHINRTIAMTGALLLVTDYIVTAALSITASYHYFQIDTLIARTNPNFLSGFITAQSSLIWDIVIIIFLVIINWRGPHFSAKFASVASAPTFFLSGLLGILALPFVPAGLANIGKFDQSIFDVFRNTTNVLLALSGIEAVANMTGVMRDPQNTPRRALNIQLVKIIFTTVTLGIAMNALPNNVRYLGHYESGKFIYETETKQNFNFQCVVSSLVYKLKGEKFECPQTTYKRARPDILIAMGEYFVPGALGKIYGLLIGISYGLLLIFGGSTAIIDMTNIAYTIAKDNELPKGFTKLNASYGVPIWGLFLAGMAPLITILIMGAKIETLGALYAIGVVGAITFNLGGTALQVVGKERLTVAMGAIIMGILFVTMAYNRMEATLFASAVVIIGLSVRTIHKKLITAQSRFYLR